MIKQQSLWQFGCDQCPALTPWFETVSDAEHWHIQAGWEKRMAGPGTGAGKILLCPHCAEKSKTKNGN